MNPDKNAAALPQEATGLKKQIFDLLKELNEEGIKECKESKNVKDSYSFSNQLFARLNEGEYIIADRRKKPINEAEKLREIYQDLKDNSIVLRIAAAQLEEKKFETEEPELSELEDEYIVINSEILGEQQRKDMLGSMAFPHEFSSDEENEGPRTLSKATVTALKLPTERKPYL